MKQIALMIVFMVGLSLPVSAWGMNHSLSDEALDDVHAKGLMVFMDFNMYFPIVQGDVSLGDINLGDINITDNTVIDSFNNAIDHTQTIGANNTGINILNGINLSGNAQSGLQAFLNINAANSVIPIGINLTVIHGDNWGTVNQNNSSFGMLNSSLFMFGGGI